MHNPIDMVFIVDMPSTTVHMQLLAKHITIVINCNLSFQNMHLLLLDLIPNATWCSLVNLSLTFCFKMMKI